MRTRPWRRVLETPLELSVSVLAVAAAVLSLVYEADRLSWVFIAVYIALGFGGLLIVVGRLRDNPDIESTGLALLLASLIFVLAGVLRRAVGVEQVLGVVLNYGALVIGFGIRLYVVRTAARARRGAADRSRS